MVWRSRTNGSNPTSLPATRPPASHRTQSLLSSPPHPTHPRYEPSRGAASFALGRRPTGLRSRPAPPGPDPRSAIGRSRGADRCVLPSKFGPLRSSGVRSRGDGIRSGPSPRPSTFTRSDASDLPSSTAPQISFPAGHPAARPRCHPRAGRLTGASAAGELGARSGRLADRMAMASDRVRDLPTLNTGFGTRDRPSGTTPWIPDRSGPSRRHSRSGRPPGGPTRTGGLGRSRVGPGVAGTLCRASSERAQVG